MAMKYQQGTVYLRGRKVKMWYGRYTEYFRDEHGKEVKRRCNIPICPKANSPKWEAERKLRDIILKETGVSGPQPAQCIRRIDHVSSVCRGTVLAITTGKMEPSLQEDEFVRDQALLGFAFRSSSPSATRSP